MTSREHICQRPAAELGLRIAEGWYENGDYPGSGANILAEMQRQDFYTEGEDNLQNVYCEGYIDLIALVRVARKWPTK